MKINKYLQLVRNVDFITYFAREQQITFLSRWNYYYYYIHLTAFIQDNLGKSAPES